MSEAVPGAAEKVGLEEIIQTVTDESIRIEASQRALVAAGIRSAPYPREMRKAEVLRQAGLFLDRLQPHMAEVREIIRGGGRQWKSRSR